MANFYHEILRKKSKLGHINSQVREKKNLNCEIKSHNYLFKFLFSGGNKLPYV